MEPRRLTFSLPLYSMVPVMTAICMLWLSFALFNALRFLGISSWALLPAAPNQVVQLQGVLHDKFYIQTENRQTFCLEQDQWRRCVLPPYELRSEPMPQWVLGRLSPDFQATSVQQGIRTGSFAEVRYYVLLDDGRIFSCETSMQDELENLWRSGSFLWLLGPLVILIGSVIAFANIFLRQAQPTLWDWRGRGERIK